MDKREQFISKAKEHVREELTRKDLLLIQAIRSLDDIDKAKALLFERLTEWSKLNFPELEIQNEELYLKFLEIAGSKEKISKERISELLGADRTEKIISFSNGSMGAPFDDEDSKIISIYAKRLLELFLLRKEITSYIEKEGNKAFRNLAYLTDAVVAARLVSTAGSLQNLAKMPASTLQVIGAEKALFKHLRMGTKPPKHGVIFQSPLISTAPLKQRGKVARALATKLAIAAKADYYSHHFIAEKLKEGMEKRLKEIREG
ncbi:MAG: hypothetical protein ABIG96_06535 [Candidatus Micrarchaeota archaeon]